MDGDLNVPVPARLPRFNQAEGNRISTGLLVRAIAEPRYLTVGHLVDLLARAGTQVSTWQPDQPIPQQPVTFLGLHRPDNLPAGSTDITADRLNALIPTDRIASVATLGHDGTSFSLTLEWI